ncbi:unnamed protein product [Sphagnum tenellum]|uniref:Secreted protein n=1 Tax=Sphagnum jensenii TaxID=128206 RepID=A0ABP1AN58_9BRYO
MWWCIAAAVAAAEAAAFTTFVLLFLRPLPFDVVSSPPARFGAIDRSLHKFLLFFGGAKGDAREPGGRLEIVGRGPGGVKYEGGAYGEDSAAGGGGGGAGGLFLVMSCVGVAGLE